MSERVDAALLAELFGVDGEGPTLSVRPAGDWSNAFGALYGGYVAGLLLQALATSLPQQHVLTAAHANFLEMVRAEPGEMPVEVFRAGRTGAAGHVRLEQGGHTVATATGWSTATRPDRGGAATATLPELPELPPARPARRYTSPSGHTVDFTEDELDVRPVGRSETDRGPAQLTWLRSRRFDPDRPVRLPLSLVALVADWVGSMPHEVATARLPERQSAIIALDLVVQIVAEPLGPWLLLDMEPCPLADGRTIARARLHDQAGAMVGAVTQQLLVLDYR